MYGLFFSLPSQDCLLFMVSQVSVSRLPLFLQDETYILLLISAYLLFLFFWGDGLRRFLDLYTSCWSTLRLVFVSSFQKKEGSRLVSLWIGKKIKQIFERRKVRGLWRSILPYIKVGVNPLGL